MCARICTVLGLVAATVAGSVSALTWEMPTGYGENSFQTVNVRQFAEDVKAATGGGLQIDVSPAGSLVAHDGIKDAVRRGKVPIGEFLLSSLGEEHAVFAVDSIPFLANTYAKAAKLWKASRPAIEARLAKQGLKVLFAVPWPPQGIYSQKEVGALSDLRGAKFRTYNATTRRFAEILGAKPVPVEVAGIAAAFETGAVVAMASSATTGAETRAWQYVRYFYHAKGWLPKNVVVVNAKAFAKLDAETRRLVESAAKRAQERGWRASEAASDAALDLLRDGGVSIHIPAAALRAELAEVGRKMTFEWTDRAGDEGIAIIEKYYTPD